MRAAGVTVESPRSAGARSRRAARVGCADRRAEIRAAAAFARAALESGHTRIGVVVPDLSRRGAPVVVREFDDALAPAALLPGAEVVRPYNVSLGEPLAARPVIHAALLAARIRHRVAAGHASRHAAALAVSGRCRRARPARAPGSMRCCAGPVKTPSPITALLRRAQAELRQPQRSIACAVARLARRRSRRAPGSLRPSAWSELFARLLKLAGWPGDGPLDSDSHQARGGVARAAGRLSPRRIWSVTSRLRRGADAGLRRMAVERVFQPQTPAAPVQVLGLLEASGLDFDQPLGHGPGRRELAAEPASQSVPAARTAAPPRPAACLGGTRAGLRPPPDRTARGRGRHRGFQPSAAVPATRNAVPVR
ncbi:MAG: hypothetical protein MZV65_34060 [Chromatiales bacterium]|nr:hypothetical protein [Chromatiales bacterium]